MFSLRLMWRLMRQPALALEGVRAAVALSPRGWWRRPPFLPKPDPTYLAWRTATAYGAPDAPVDAEDVVSYLAWRRLQRRTGSVSPAMRGVAGG